MIEIGESRVPVCQGITRREWLRAGSLAPLGLTLPDLLLANQAEAASKTAAPPSFGRAKSCIVAFLFGAPAHQDLWDLKPEAASEYRGEFSPIGTSADGIQVGEHLPKTAAQAHRFSIIRSVTHPDDTHTVAMHYMLT